MTVADIPLQLMTDMRARGERGSTVTLICDPGDRHLGTYDDPQWVADQGLDEAVYRHKPRETIGIL